MKKLNKVWFVFINIILAIIIFLGLLLLVSFLPMKNNFRILAVTSGSMQPAIKVGSIVVVQPIKNYKVGDIISFNSGVTKKDNTTHRIVEIKGSGNNQTYVTKGDANKTNDQKEVPISKVIGKKIFTIPFVGYLLVYIKTLPGLILLIIIPATIIIYDEFTKIKNEAISIKNKRKEKRNAKNL